jgi:DNA-binding MarR family transcriptional regulator
MEMADRNPPRLGVLARLLVRALADRTRAELAVAGFPDLRPVHTVVLAQLGEEGARITDMAARSGITKQAVTLLVDYLEARGYVGRVADPHDGRAKLVQLTDRGRAAAATANRIADEIEHTWATQIGAERLAHLKETLRVLGASLRTGEPGGGGVSPGAQSHH